MDANRIAALELIVDDFEDLDLWVTNDGRVEVQDIDCTDDELRDFREKLRAKSFRAEDTNEDLYPIIRILDNLE